MAFSNRQQRSLEIENLEDRRLMAASIGYYGGTLYIVGDNANDTAIVTEQSGRVFVSGTLNTPFPGIDANRVQQIYFYGFGGNDYFYNRTDIQSVAYGHDGNDKLIGGSGYDWMDGGAGNDNLRGDISPNQGWGDSLRGGSGDDTLYGGGGNDILRGDAGNDQLFGHAGDDSMYGGMGDDTLHGADGSDALFGDDGHDFLEGGDGADSLMGGLGDDHLDGAAGGVDDNDRDSLNGGSGRDHFIDYRHININYPWGVYWSSHDVLEDFSWYGDTKETVDQGLTSADEPLALNL